MAAALHVLSLVLLVAPAMAGGGAPGVQVIANPGVGITELTAGDLKAIFLGSKTAIGGETVEPVFEQAGEAHQIFLRTYLGKSDTALRNHFKALVFSGKGVQPKTFPGDAEVVRYVVRTKGAIGYVSPTADVAGAKKIDIK